MRITTIMPAFNAERTLADAVASVQAQTMPEWTLVIVDDGSHDGTAAIADRLAASDGRIRVAHQANGGEAAARNAGLALVGTPWVSFLDADDWIGPEYFARLGAALEADSSLDAVHCGWARVAADGTVIPDDYQPPTGKMFDVWARRSAFPVHACVVRSDLVRRLDGFDPAQVKSTDWDFWQRVARTGARFGAVPEVLAYYRMSEGAASLEAAAMLADGLRVLRRGHAPDPRVPDPDPAFAAGAPPEEVPTQAFYLLSWCAGLVLGSGGDARPLLAQVQGMRFPALYPDAVATCIFDAAPLPSRAAPPAWEALWPTTHHQIAAFLDALEHHSGAAGLAAATTTALLHRIASHSPTWQPVLALEAARLEAVRAEAAAGRAALEDGMRALADRLDTAQRDRERLQEALATQQGQSAEIMARLDATQRQRDGLQEALAEQQRQADAISARLDATLASLTDHATAQQLQLSEQERTIGALRDEEARTRATVGDLEATLARATAETARLQASPERRLGDLLLNRLHLAAALNAGYGATAAISQRATLARLAAERLVRRDRPRVLATVCTEFPIYSQTFVHQELAQLADAGHAVRVAYSQAAPRSALGGRFDGLWQGRRRLVQHRPLQRRHFAHYERRMPDRVAALLDRLSVASGLPVEALREHDNVLEGFSFTRMAEAYAASYLHSYFFYDRSLMALIASELLGIPRGVTCYADHRLADYELKVVPLHLARADLVVATSARIREELLELAPDMASERILVKPNGIDGRRFPVVARPEPVGGAPHRLVTVCRIEPKKGLIHLVEAVHQLQQTGHAVEAHIVGVVDEWSPSSRACKDELDRRITELGLWGTVHLEGRQDHAGVLKFLGRGHLFVAPFVETATGDKDGIPTALLEAMATGIPVVASDAGSIGEVITSGRDGVMVPQGDSDALAAAIADLLASPDRRSVLGEVGAATVRDRFDVATCEQEFHARVRALIARGARRDAGGAR